jgi:hypothetical protein
LSDAAFTLEVILVVIATPVKAAVAADNLRKDRLAIFGLRVTLRPAAPVPLPEKVLILLLAIDYSPYRVEYFFVACRLMNL